MNVHTRTFMKVHCRKRTFEIGRHEESVLYLGEPGSPESRMTHAP